MPSVRAPVHGPLHDDASIGHEFRPKGLVRSCLPVVTGHDRVAGVGGQPCRMDPILARTRRLFDYSAALTEVCRGPFPAIERT